MRKSARRVETPALIVRSVAYGESDLIVTALTEREGKVAAIVRGARKSSRRASAAALEPMHTVLVTYEDKGTELATMKEARVIQPRAGLLKNLDAIEAAGMMLRWARHMFPPKTPEPAAYATLIEVLDALDTGAIEDCATELACAGLRLLADVGWGLELEQCVRCGAKCPEDAAAHLDAQQGGIVCRRCGGARVVLGAAMRRAAIAAATRKPGAPSDAVAPFARGIIVLVESAMSAHLGYDAK
jgi:DNA repair protein RecO (recombination protein O)